MLKNTGLWALSSDIQIGWSWEGTQNLLLMILQLIWEWHSKKHYTNSLKLNYFQNKMGSSVRISNHSFKDIVFLPTASQIFMCSCQTHNQQKSRSVDCPGMTVTVTRSSCKGLEIWASVHFLMLTNYLANVFLRQWEDYLIPRNIWNCKIA